MVDDFTLPHLTDCLDASRERYEVLDAGGGAQFIVTRYGGRIFGPFFEAGGPSVLWTCAALGNKESFAALVGKRGWNIGGDRVWIAPELQYNVRDPARFHETYDLPDQIDPGNYDLSSTADGALVLSQDMAVRPHDHKGREKRLRLERRMKAAADPLASVSSIGHGPEVYRYAGYSHEVTLVDQSVDDLCSANWNITQVSPGGVAIVPTVGELEYVNHWQPPDQEHLAVGSKYLKFHILGDAMFKIGLKAASHFGRSGYFRPTGHGQASLLVKLFFNNPSESYLAEAPHSPGIRGYSYELYHDDGNLGGFGELECHGRPVGAGAGRDRSTDEFVNWFYSGEEGAIQRVARLLLGVEL